MKIVSTIVSGLAKIGRGFGRLVTNSAKRVGNAVKGVWDWIWGKKKKAPPEPPRPPPEPPKPPPEPPRPPTVEELPLLVTAGAAFHVYDQSVHPDNVELARMNLKRFYANNKAGAVSVSVKITVFAEMGGQREILAEEETDIGCEADPDFDTFRDYYYAALRQWIEIMQEEGVYDVDNYMSTAIFTYAVVIYPPTA